MCACEKNTKSIDKNREIIENKVETLRCHTKKIKNYIDFKIDKDIEDKKKCYKKMEDTLKKREKRKNEVQKEMNSAFIPCFVKKKADEFLDCLKCYRWTKSCLAYKKQEVFQIEEIKKLVKKQLVIVENDLKSVENFLKEFNTSTDKYKKSTDFLEGGKLPERANALINYCKINNNGEEDEIERLSEAIKNAIGKQLLDEKDRKNIEYFIKAKRKIEKDFSIKNHCEESLFSLAKKRYNLLRNYDENGASLLKELGIKIFPKSDIDRKKLEFDSKLIEYEEAVNAAQKKYDAAMTLFSQIAKSPQLNCTQRRCLSLANDNVNEKCKKEVVEKEECYFTFWENLNRDRIKLQKEIVENEKCTEISQGEENACMTKQCDLIAAHKKMSCLDDLEASIPDYLWENIIKYEDACYLLSQVVSISIQNSTDKDKKSVLGEALEEWVNAVVYSEENDHYDQFELHAYELLKAQVDYAEKNKAERIEIAVRGDAKTFIGQDFYLVFQDIVKIISSINGKNGENGKKCRKETACSGIIYDTEPYALPVKYHDFLAGYLVTVNEELPKPCSTQCVLPCVERNKTQDCDDDKSCSGDNKRCYPCAENPACIIKEKEDIKKKHSSDKMKPSSCQSTTHPMSPQTQAPSDCDC
jgi:hypothetical protein